MGAWQGLILKGVASAFAISFCILLYIWYLKSTHRDSPKLRAIAVVLMSYSIATWAIVYLVYVPYANGVAPTFSRHHTFMPLTQPGAHLSMVFHAGICIALFILGTWFGVRLWNTGVRQQ